VDGSIGYLQSSQTLNMHMSLRMQTRHSAVTPCYHVMH